MATSVQPKAQQQTGDLSRVHTRQSSTKLARLESARNREASTISSAPNGKLDEEKRETSRFLRGMMITVQAIDFCVYLVPKTFVYDPVMNNIVRPLARKFIGEPAKEKVKIKDCVRKPVKKVKNAGVSKAGGMATAVKVKADEGAERVAAFMQFKAEFEARVLGAFKKKFPDEDATTLESKQRITKALQTLHDRQLKGQKITPKGIEHIFDKPLKA